MPILFATESLFRDELSDTSYLTTGSSVLRFEWSRHPLLASVAIAPPSYHFSGYTFKLVYRSLKYPLPQNLKMRIHSNALMKLDQNRGPLGLAIACLFFVLPAAVPVNAQEINGTPGSPSDPSIDGRQLPAPPPPFGGVIKHQRQGVQAVVAAASRAAQGRA